MISNEKVEIPCPNPDCEGGKLVLRLAEVSPGKKVSCPACGADVELGGDDVGRSVKKLDDALKNLGRKF